MRTTKTITLGEVKEILKKHFKAERVDNYIQLELQFSDLGNIYEIDDENYLFDVVVEEEWKQIFGFQYI